MQSYSVTLIKRHLETFCGGALPPTVHDAIEYFDGYNANEFLAKPTEFKDVAPTFTQGVTWALRSLHQKNVKEVPKPQKQLRPTRYKEEPEIAGDEALRLLPEKHITFTVSQDGDDFRYCNRPVTNDEYKIAREKLLKILLEQPEFSLNFAKVIREMLKQKNTVPCSRDAMSVAIHNLLSDGTCAIKVGGYDKLAIAASARQAIQQEFPPLGNSASETIQHAVRGK